MREIAFGLTRRAALLPLLAAALQPLKLQPALAVEVLQPDKGFMTGSGLRYFDFREGEGPTPRFGQFIQFHYVAYTADESKGGLKQFDSTYSRGEPYFTKHGNGFTAQGIEEALHTMRPGALRRVILPPAISYTANKGPVPVSLEGRETLYTAVGSQEPIIFDLQLVSVFDDLLDRGDYDDADVADLRRSDEPPPSGNAGSVSNRGFTAANQ